MLLSKSDQSEKTTLLCDPNYMTFWKRQTYGNYKQIRGFQGVGDEEEAE